MNDSTEPGNQPALLLTGGTGFVGRAVQNAARKDSAYRLRMLVRQPSANVGVEGGIFSGNLSDIPALRRATESVSAVVHSAHYIGYDPELCHQINVNGTKNLLQAAQKSGAEKFIYISTTGVYGGRHYRGLEENEITPSPSSTLSRSRREAEILVLEAGGTVVRPNLVYGEGDRWVVPLWVKTFVLMNALIDGGSAKVSTIRVDRLGSIVVQLLHQQLEKIQSSVFHANDAPSTVQNVITECADKLFIPISDHGRSILFPEAIRDLKRSGVTEHQLSMLWEDNWFSAQQLDGLISRTELDGFSLDARAVAWYRDLLGTKQRPRTLPSQPQRHQPS